jgi:hypothetical protein
MFRALALLFVLALSVTAAPAPFPRTAKPLPLTRETLVGTWVMHWGDVRAVVVLSSGGDYTCVWPGATYVGTWGLDREGRFWITESCRPGDACSWQSYAICLSPCPYARRHLPGSLAGPTRVGSSSISVRFVKKD